MKIVLITPLLLFIIIPMVRKARIVVSGFPHHVYMHTVDQRVIFRGDNDRRKYLSILSCQSQIYQVDILAWSLMREHINLVVVPDNKEALNMVIGRTNYSYARYVATRRSYPQNFWRNRFQSCALDKTQTRNAVKYVEHQPIYDRVVRQPQKYMWSSAKAHCDGEDEYQVLSFDTWPTKFASRKWPEFLAKRLDADIREKIRIYTQTGRPLGSKRWVAQLEEKYKMRLAPLPIGRPLGS